LVQAYLGRWKGAYPRTDIRTESENRREKKILVGVLRGKTWYQKMTRIQAVQKLPNQEVQIQNKYIVSVTLTDMEIVEKS
jgi:hypothetical protein